MTSLRATLGAVAALATVGLAACAAPQAPATSATRSPELAAPAEPLETPVLGAEAPSPAEGTAAIPSGEPDPSPTGTHDPPPPSDPQVQASPDPSASADGAPPGSVFRVVGEVADPARDQGIEGPGHADLRRITIEDDGERLRVRVEVREPFPTPLADGEVIGIGVDLLDHGDGESAYQLFADGGADGWLAYLQTPDGFVSYPGEFRVGGAVVEFVVPWNAIGSPARGPFGGFLDWSRARLLSNAAAGDRAPDGGTAGFDRT